MSQFLARKTNRRYDELIYNVVSWIISGFEGQNIHCLTHKLIIRKYLEQNFNTWCRLEYNKLEFENKSLPDILYFASILFVYIFSELRIEKNKDWKKTKTANAKNNFFVKVKSNETPVCQDIRQLQSRLLNKVSKGEETMW